MRIWSVKNIEDRKHEYIPFDGEWYQAFGCPEKTGCWIIWGKAGQGKSRFALLLARKFEELGYRVLFLTLEMGDSDDFKSDINGSGIRSGVSNMIFSDNCTIGELDEYLNKQRSPDVIIIDSIQYFEKICGAKAAEVIQLRKKYPKKIFVFISHIEGNEVEGKMAYEVKRDSFKRIYVEGFRALHIGRGKGGPRKYFVIWDKGYEKYWIKNIKDETYESESEETD